MNQTVKRTTKYRRFARQYWDRRLLESETMCLRFVDAQMSGHKEKPRHAMPVTRCWRLDDRNPSLASDPLAY